VAVLRLVASDRKGCKPFYSQPRAIAIVLAWQVARAFELHSTAIPRLRAIVTDVATAARKMQSRKLAFPSQKIEQMYQESFKNQCAFRKYRGI